MNLPNYIFLCFLILFSLDGVSQNAYNVDFHIKGYENQEVIVAREFLNRYPVVDTLQQYAPGKFIFQGDSSLTAGVYLLVLPPDNNFLTFLIDEGDSQFSIKTNIDQLAEGIEIDGSVNNKVYYDHLNYSNAQVAKLNAILSEQHAAQGGEDLKSKFEAEIKALKDYRTLNVTRFSHLLAANLIRLEMEQEIPDFADLPLEEKKLQKLAYRKEHFFDFVNMADPRMVHSEAFFNKVFYYIQELTPNDFDALIESVDRVLELMKPSKTNFKYYLDHLMIDFASSDVIGMDKVYCHIVENYYAKGMAPWVQEEDLAEMVEDVKRRKPLLLNNIAPDIEMEDQFGESLSLHKTISKYTVLYLWQPGCSHCKLSMPYMKSFHAKYKDRGIKIFSACTKIGSKTEECWKYIEENELTGWINVTDKDLSSRFVQKYMAEKTPKIYILDADKRIILKDVGADQLDEIFESILMDQPREEPQGG